MTDQIFSNYLQPISKKRAGENESENELPFDGFQHVSSQSEAHCRRQSVQLSSKRKD